MGLNEDETNYFYLLQVGRILRQRTEDIEVRLCNYFWQALKQMSMTNYNDKKCDYFDDAKNCNNGEDGQSQY